MFVLAGLWDSFAVCIFKLVGSFLCHCGEVLLEIFDV